MSDDRRCPYCDEEVYADETIDTEWEYGSYYDTVVGHCPKCGKKFIWTDIYSFSCSTNFREIKS